VALALGIVASACGMTTVPRPAPRCHVVVPAKLPADSGGEATLCAALDRAVAAQSLKTRFTVAVHVGERSMLSADVTLADGRTLPTLRMAQMDRPISKGALERFGAAIADHVARAAR
jgi:hypothetical protein